MRTDYWYSTSGPSCRLLESVELPIEYRHRLRVCSESIPSRSGCLGDGSRQQRCSIELWYHNFSNRQPIFDQLLGESTRRERESSDSDLSRSSSVAILVSTRYCFARGACKRTLALARRGLPLVMLKCFWKGLLLHMTKIWPSCLDLDGTCPSTVVAAF